MTTYKKNRKKQWRDTPLPVRLDGAQRQDLEAIRRWVSRHRPHGKPASYAEAACYAIQYTRRMLALDREM